MSVDHPTNAEIINIFDIQQIIFYQINLIEYGFFAWYIFNQEIALKLHC